MDLTAYQVKKMKEQPEKYYLLVNEPECTNVCYWYVPERLRPRQFPQAYTRDWHIELGKVIYINSPSTFLLESQELIVLKTVEIIENVK